MPVLTPKTPLATPQYTEIVGCSSRYAGRANAAKIGVVALAAPREFGAAMRIFAQHAPRWGPLCPGLRTPS